MEGKVVDRRPVCQKQGGEGGVFLFNSGIGEWFRSGRGDMESGRPAGGLSLISAALSSRLSPPLRGVEREEWHTVGSEPEGAGWRRSAAVAQQSAAPSRKNI
jgi:hypothetical protein